MRSILGGRLTPGVLWLLLVEVGLFLAIAFSGGADEAKLDWIARHVAIHGEGLRAGKIWVVATALLAHLDARPLISGGVGLWLFGTPLEHRFGTRRLVTFVVGCGLCGNVLAAFAAAAGVPGAQAGCAGASFGLLVAWGVHFGEVRASLPGGAVIRCRHLAIFSAALVLLSNLISGPGLETATLIGGGAGAWAITSDSLHPSAWLPAIRRRLRRRKLQAHSGGRDEKTRWN